MSRKAINFDLDTEALQENYPAEKGAWRKAYDDIRQFLRANDFEEQCLKE